MTFSAAPRPQFPEPDRTAPVAFPPRAACASGPVGVVPRASLRRTTARGGERRRSPSHFHSEMMTCCLSRRLRLNREGLRAGRTDPGAVPMLRPDLLFTMNSRRAA